MNNFQCLELFEKLSIFRKRTYIKKIEYSRGKFILTFILRF